MKKRTTGYFGVTITIPTRPQGRYGTVIVYHTGARWFLDLAVSGDTPEISIFRAYSEFLTQFVDFEIHPDVVVVTFGRTLNPVPSPIPLSNFLIELHKAIAFASEKIVSNLLKSSTSVVGSLLQHAEGDEGGHQGPRQDPEVAPGSSIALWPYY